MNNLTVVVGALPPPMGGAAKNTKIIADELCTLTNTIVINTSVGAFAHNRSIIYHAKRAFKTLACAFGIIRHSFTSNKTMYIVPDGGLGMIYTLIYVLIAYIFQYKVFFHHRTFLYIDSENALMRLSSLLLKKRLNHIFLSDGMKEKFLLRYPYGDNCFISDNARFAIPENIEKDFCSDEIRIGHLSNLCDEKGFYEVIHVYQQLKKSGLNIKLLLAGAPVTKEVAIHLEQLLADNQQSVLYLDHLEGTKKDEFYRNIHFFLFPTKFKQEAQPNVLYEAMAKGAICISWGRACIPEMITDNAGLVIDPADDYVEQAVRYVVENARSLSDMRRLSENAIAEVNSKKDLAIIQYKQMLEAIAGKSETN